MGYHTKEDRAPSELAVTFPVSGANIVEAGHPKYLDAGDVDPATRVPIRHGRVYISQGRKRPSVLAQYFEGVTKEAWEFHVGGDKLCEKWLKSRRGRPLSASEIMAFPSVVHIANETVALMDRIDDAVGAWPL